MPYSPGDFAVLGLRHDEFGVFCRTGVVLGLGPCGLLAAWGVWPLLSSALVVSRVGLHELAISW